jgi:murein DD-endopeptidase MepM/ murein hydrolase activator NlpD
MKKSTARIVALAIFVAMMSVLSCQKSDTSAAQKGGQDQETALTPVVDQESAETADAAAAAAKVKSPVPGYSVSYPFGVKDLRYAAGYHTGDDYASPTGTKVVAVLDGTIAWSNDNGGAYGKWIGLRATNGRDYVYCHLSKRSVSTGTKVTAGQKLGEVGATGNVTGPHLHFEDRPKGGGYGQVRKPTW